MKNVLSCAFTGHRPQSFSFGYDETSAEFKALMGRVRNCIIQACNAGCRDFYCGMAEGADLWCGEMIVDMKNSFDPPLEIFPVVPYIAQPDGMSEKNKARYQKIMEASKERFLVGRKFSKSCFQKRNYFLVDSCDAVIAIWDRNHTFSGTAQTIRYAQKKKKKIWIIEP